MGAVCTQLQAEMNNMNSRPTDGKDPRSVPLSGEPFQRLKENFDAPYGETYELIFTKDDMAKFGAELITKSGPCLQLLITHLKPFQGAHTKGVAPGTKIVAVNGQLTQDLSVLLSAKDALGEGDSMSITFERPAWGYVVAKTGEFAGKPTISTYTAMGIKHDDLPGQFGKSWMHELNFQEICYFHEVGQRMIHLAVNTPGWGEDGAARLFDAPYWEKDCIDDAEFQSNFNKLKARDQTKCAWCPMKCDEVGLPLDFEEMTHPRGDDERCFNPMSARFGVIDDCVTSEMPYWTKFIDMLKMMDKIRNESASSVNVQTTMAAKFLKGKVYIVPESDYQEEKRGHLKKYWTHEIWVTDSSDADLYVKKVDEEPTQDGEWQMVDSKEEADHCLYIKTEYMYTCHFFIRYVDDEEYIGLSPPGCAAGKMFYEQTHDNNNS